MSQAIRKTHFLKLGGASANHCGTTSVYPTNLRLARGGHRPEPGRINAHVGTVQRAIAKNHILDLFLPVAVVVEGRARGLALGGTNVRHQLIRTHLGVTVATVFVVASEFCGLGAGHGWCTKSIPKSISIEIGPVRRRIRARAGFGCGSIGSTCLHAVENNPGTTAKQQKTQPSHQVSVRTMCAFRQEAA